MFVARVDSFDLYAGGNDQLTRIVDRQPAPTREPAADAGFLEDFAHRGCIRQLVVFDMSARR